MPRARNPHVSRKPEQRTPTAGRLTAWRWTWWHFLACVAGAIFVAAAIDAAARETPTIDEFAHVPAGLLHWRTGEFGLYRNNPPPGKMWLALPLALDASVQSPEYKGPGVGWAPWFHGMCFEQLQPARYLRLMFRARLMVIPLVLAMAGLVFVWCRQLYGLPAAAVSTSLLLLSPTVLAHGHLATVDIASTVTILAAVMAMRWSAASPAWQRDVLAGAALGLALAVKFSALFLIPLLPVLYVAAVWRAPDLLRQTRNAAGHLAIYTATAWLVLNASMGFSGTFDRVGSLEPRSESMQRLVERLPPWQPLGLPRAYVNGVDALQEDMEIGDYAGYLHGRWSENGWASYYFLAFALKESEPVVVLMLLALLALPLVVRDYREAMFVLAPPAVLLFIAAALNSLCLGIRYVLPAYPFLFVMLGACFAWLPRCMAQPPEAKGAPVTPGSFGACWWVAGPLLLYAVALVMANHPSYLSYFNRFIGGPAHGAEWLVDSNLDWGQDLYRLPARGKELGVDRWRLLYFGHVDPDRYGLKYDLPEELPEFGFYAVSVNFWKGMSYPVLSGQNQVQDVRKRQAWLKRMLPSEQLGSFVLFDLRPDSLRKSARAQDDYNASFIFLAHGETQHAIKLLERARQRDPALPETYLALGDAYHAAGNQRAAIDVLRRGLQLRSDWYEALNNLAWQLATTTDRGLRNPVEAVQLAERAGEVADDAELSHLDTLAIAYAAAGRRDDAIRVCSEGLIRANAMGSTKAAEGFRKTRQVIQSNHESPAGN